MYRFMFKQLTSPCAYVMITSDASCMKLTHSTTDISVVVDFLQTLAKKHYPLIYLMIPSKNCTTSKQNRMITFRKSAQILMMMTSPN